MSHYLLTVVIILFSRTIKTHIQCVSVDSASLIIYPEIKATEVLFQSWKCYLRNFYFRIDNETGGIHRNTLYSRALQRKLAQYTYTLQFWGHSLETNYNWATKIYTSASIIAKLQRAALQVVQMCWLKMTPARAIYPFYKNATRYNYINFLILYKVEHGTTIYLCVIDLPV